jgi:hypothetical protein
MLDLGLGLFAKHNTPPINLYVPVDEHKIVELHSPVSEKGEYTETNLYAHNPSNPENKPGNV